MRQDYDDGESLTVALSRAHRKGIEQDLLVLLALPTHSSSRRRRAEHHSSGAYWMS